MGICESKQGKDSEKIVEKKFSVPLEVINKASKAICKLTIRGNLNTYATGFFMKVSDTEKYLITNYHNISKNNIYDDTEIEIHNQKTMKLNLNNRKIKYFPQPIDITMIEIKTSDEIYNDILFLDYDLSCLKGYEEYKDSIVFMIEHPNGDNAEYACGKIVNVYDFEFDHDISTEKGQSGSPIILYNKNINRIQVIGIHKEAYETVNLNIGTFIGEIFNKENNNIPSNIYNNNYIIAEIDIKDDEINKDVRIINSYEEYIRSPIFDGEIKKELMNEKEIKKCRIRINNQLIPFNYFFKFKNKGKYIIKYSFNNYLSKTNHMFYGCASLTNINLSNFNTQNVTNMSNMFSLCLSLTNINLSNFNTQNVIDMSSMFYNCLRLTDINLSNFKTQNVTNMRCMFSECISLTNINLSNFNTQNVTNMSEMFSRCSSLTKINLSNFNTQNVKDMNGMFWGCSSLTNINLSNFNTKNVKDMSGMFFDCSSLTDINLSNFNTQNVTNMFEMFKECFLLSNINLSNFNTQNVTNMSNMFASCSSLTNINLSNFNTQNVTNMSFMFYRCSSLTNINLSNFNTQNVKDMRCMFASCSSLTNINLSNFNTQNVNNMGSMFDQCLSLTSINIITNDRKIIDQFVKDKMCNVIEKYKEFI